MPLLIFDGGSGRIVTHRGSSLSLNAFSFLVKDKYSGSGQEKSFSTGPIQITLRQLDQAAREVAYCYYKQKEG